MSLPLRRNKSPIVLVLLIVFQLILISLQVPLGNEASLFEKSIFMIFSPLEHSVQFLVGFISKGWKNYIFLHSAQKENEELRKKLFYLSQENSILKILLDKSEEEKKIRELLEDKYENIISARVIGRDASNGYRSVVINKGSLDGIKKDMVVLDKNGFLAGRVVEPITFREARIQLITDEKSGVAVDITGKSIKGIVSGDGNGACYLKYVLSTDEPVLPGDKVITNGVDGIYPPSVDLGFVSEINVTSSLFKDIRVNTFCDIEGLDHLAVLRIRIKEFF
ncbi:MAG: rod shape-determining protein MreC [Candidatus Aminicenantes bacterium]|nr:rod shape-determining protein MreC [Candidatus Aminicenantes bacterium]